MIELNKNSAGGRVVVVQDLGAGSSGKGSISAWLADKYGFDMATNNWMTNAGHYVERDDGVRILTQHIPSSFINPNTALYINAGAAIDLDTLFKEINTLETLGYSIKDRLTIHPLANVIVQRDKDLEKEMIKTGTTFKGCGASIARKVMRTSWSKLARDYEELQPYIHGLSGDRATSAINLMISKGGKVIVEGSQGVDLDMNHSEYPYCLSKSSKILMADNTTKRIDRIKIGDHVKSINKNGTIIESKVINVWKKKNTKKLYKIITETSEKSASGVWSGASYTQDHKINTTAGIKKIENLNAGDEIYYDENMLYSDSLQIFLGSMLGDGTVTNCAKNRHTASFNITHCKKQIDYLKLKSAIINHHIPGKIRPIINGKSSFKPGAISYRFETRHSHEIYKMATKYGCYDKKTPDFEKIIDDINCIGLAIWYQDDGRLKIHKFNKKLADGVVKRENKRVYLHTNGFSVDGVKKLAGLIYKKFGLTFKIEMVNNNLKTKKYPILRLSLKDNQKWFNMISKYISDDMKYKIPEEYTTSNNIIHNVPLSSTQLVTGISEFIPKCKKDFKYVYDIEIESTHNFFARNGKHFINVENCTSRQTLPQQLISDAGIPFQAVTNIVANIRTNPIRINNQSAANENETCYTGNYWDAKEISWRDVAIQAGYEYDEFMQKYEKSLMTSVTKKIRRVFEFPVERMRFCHTIIGGMIPNNNILYSLNFVNFVDKTVEGVKSVDLLMTPKIVEWLNKNLYPIIGSSSLKWVRTGPKHSEIVEI
jgi:hypothetical protein